VLCLRAGICHLHCAAHQWLSERADAESRSRIQVMADREIGLLDSLTAERYYKVCCRRGRLPDISFPSSFLCVVSTPSCLGIAVRRGLSGTHNSALTRSRVCLPRPGSPHTS
jgi:hypothetical protein